jgi:hypothetical protein
LRQIICHQGQKIGVNNIKRSRRIRRARRIRSLRSLRNKENIIKSNKAAAHHPVAPAAHPLVDNLLIPKGKGVDLRRARDN